MPAHPPSGRRVIGERGLPSLLRNAQKLANMAAPPQRKSRAHPLPYRLTPNHGKPPSWAAWDYIEGDYQSIPESRKAELAQEARAAGASGRMDAIRFAVWTVRHGGKA